MALVECVVIDEAVGRSRGERIECTCNVAEAIFFPGRGDGGSSSQNASEFSERREQCKSRIEGASEDLSGDVQIVVSELLLRLLLRLSYGGVRMVRYFLEHAGNP